MVASWVPLSGLAQRFQLEHPHPVPALRSESLAEEPRAVWTAHAKSKCAKEVLASDALALRVLANRGSTSARVWRCCYSRANLGCRCMRDRPDWVVVSALPHVTAVSRREPVRSEDARVLAILAEDLPQMRKIDEVRSLAGKRVTGSTRVDPVIRPSNASWDRTAALT